MEDDFNNIPKQLGDYAYKKDYIGEGNADYTNYYKIAIGVLLFILIAEGIIIYLGYNGKLQPIVNTTCPINVSLTCPQTIIPAQPSCPVCPACILECPEINITFSPSIKNYINNS